MKQNRVIAAERHGMTRYGVGVGLFHLCSQRLWCQLGWETHITKTGSRVEAIPSLPPCAQDQRQVVSYGEHPQPGPQEVLSNMK